MIRYFVPALLVACTEVGMSPTPNGEVVTHTNTVTNTEYITNTVTVPGDTDSTEDPDPCDLEFRAYAEDGHYVDVAVGAMPLVQATGGSVELAVGTEMPSGVFEVTSRQGCGDVEILGVQILIVRTDGAELVKVDSEDNELIDMQTNASALTVAGWYDATWDSSTAPTIGLDWNSEWTADPAIGEFTSYILGANDSKEYLVRANVLEQVPAGEYVLTYSLSWRDPETGTEVWGANIDDAEWHITLL